MSRWTRASVDTWCGLCLPARRIEVGEPMLLIAGMPRCVGCAGERVPVDLPALPEREVVDVQPTIKRGLFRGTSAQAHDWKSKQAGER